MAGEKVISGGGGGRTNVSLSFLTPNQPFILFLYAVWNSMLELVNRVTEDKSRVYTWKEQLLPSYIIILNI